MAIFTLPSWPDALSASLISTRPSSLDCRQGVETQKLGRVGGWAGAGTACMRAGRLVHKGREGIGIAGQEGPVETQTTSNTQMRSPGCQR